MGISGILPQINGIILWRKTIESSIHIVTYRELKSMFGTIEENINKQYNDVSMLICRILWHIETAEEERESESLKKQQRMLDQMKLKYNPYTKMILDMKKDEKIIKKHMSIFSNDSSQNDVHGRHKSK